MDSSECEPSWNDSSLGLRNPPNLSAGQPFRLLLADIECPIDLAGDCLQPRLVTAPHLGRDPSVETDVVQGLPHISPRANRLR